MTRFATTVPLALAGLAWTAGQAVQPDIGLEPAERYDHVVDARALESISGGLLLLAGVLLVVSGLFATRRLVELAPGRGGRLLTIGTTMLALGGIWLAAGRGAFNLNFVRVTSPEINRDTAITILEGEQGIGFVPMLLTLPCLLLGPILLAIGLRRAGLSNWLPLALWVVGIGVFLGTEFTIKAGEIVGIGIAACALAAIGRALDSEPATAAPTTPTWDATRGSTS